MAPAASVPDYLYSAALWAPSFDAQALATRALHGAVAALPGLEPLLATQAAFVRQYAFFLLACGAYLALTLVVHAVLSAAWPAYRAVGDKRWYVVANLLKSAVLGAQVLSPSWWFYSAQEYACNLAPLGLGVSRAVGAPWGVTELPCSWSVDRGHDAYVKAIAALYIVTDVVALVTVPRLPLTTKVHHFATCAFGLWVLAVPIAPSPVLHKLLMYGAFSTLAFPVNTFLAMRCTNPASAAVGVLARVSLVLYVLVCACNWGLHALWLVDGTRRGVLSAAEYLYALSLYLFIRDDLVLMGWLSQYGKHRNNLKGEKTA